MRREKREGFSQGVDTQGESTILRNERGKKMKKTGVNPQREGNTYFGVKSVVRKGRQVVEGRVFVELECYNERVFRFSIGLNQLKQLLVGSKNGKKVYTRD